MKCLLRNKRKIYYANYASTTEEKIGDWYTGQKIITYTNPIAIEAVVSNPSGGITFNAFGRLDEYDKSIAVEPCDGNMDNNSVFWIDCTPTFNNDGSTDTPYDYVVTRISKGLDHMIIALSKVKVSNG